MENILCKYHQNSPIWHCGDCNSYFCSKCIPGSSANYPKNKPRCVLCQGFLEFEGGTHTAEPFWNRAADFFRYPLHKHSVTALLTLSAALTVAPVLPLTLLLLILIIAGAFRYSLLIVNDCIDGSFSPPKPSELFHKDEDHLFLKFIAIFIWYGLVIGIFAGLSVTMAQVFAFVIPFLIPANIILLATSRQFLPAINPLKILSLIAKIGAPYFLMSLLVLVISNSPYYAILILSTFVPDWLMLPFVGIVSVYFCFVTCAMMGYTVYQYQKELGYSSHNDSEYYLEPAIFEKNKAKATIHIFIQEGKYKEAREQLLAALKNDRENLELHDMLHRLLLATNDLQDLQQHTLHCSELFIKKGYAGKAASYYLDTQKKVAAFQLDKPDMSLTVAEALFTQGKYKEVLLLLKDMRQRFPDYGLIFNAYFLMAKAYAEGLHDDATAIKVLDFLAKNYAKNTRMPELEAYRGILLSHKH